jgi:GxxExxY protein
MFLMIYKGKDLGGQLKLDLLVEDLIIVENKAVEIMIPLYQAQLLSYLKLTGKPKGLLINFNSVNIKEQLVSLVTEEFAKLPKG